MRSMLDRFHTNLPATNGRGNIRGRRSEYPRSRGEYRTRIEYRDWHAIHDHMGKTLPVDGNCTVRGGGFALSVELMVPSLFQETRRNGLCRCGCAPRGPLTIPGWPGNHWYLVPGSATPTPEP